MPTHLTSGIGDPCKRSAPTVAHFFQRGQRIVRADAHALAGWLVAAGSNGIGLAAVDQRHGDAGIEHVTGCPAFDDIPVVVIIGQASDTPIEPAMKCRSHLRPRATPRAGGQDKPVWPVARKLLFPKSTAPFLHLPRPMGQRGNTYLPTETNQLPTASHPLAAALNTVRGWDNCTDGMRTSCKVAGPCFSAAANQFLVSLRSRLCRPGCQNQSRPSSARPAHARQLALMVPRGFATPMTNVFGRPLFRLR